MSDEPRVWHYGKDGPFALGASVMPRSLRRRRSAGLMTATYVGRPSKWGNPFKIGRDGTRAEVIEKFRANLTDKQKHEIRNELHGKHLVCWCSPKPCHADVLLEIAKEPR